MEQQQVKDPIMGELLKWKERVGQALFHNSCQMTEEQTTAFIQLSLNEEKIMGDVSAFLGEVSEDRFYQMISLRAEAIELRINPVVLVFLAGYICDRPGTAVVYLSYLRLIQMEKNKDFNMTEFTYTFPDGFLQEPQLEEIWRSQKLGSVVQSALKQRYPGVQITDNMLDILSLFRSR
jgi:hypothetical protein